MISIVIPTRQEGRYIRETIERIKQELSLPHEIIVSDGGSNDDTVEIARSLADQVIVFPGGRTHSPAIGRNDGARVARGEYLLFLDADVRLRDMNAALSDALARFEKDPDLVGLTGLQLVYPETERLGDKIVFGFDNMQNRFRNNVLHRGWACGKCMLVRKSAFEKVGGFREQLVFGEDYDFFLRIAKIGSTRFLSSLAAYHSGRRIHAYGTVKFLFVWIVNGVSVLVRDKAHVDEWPPVR